MKVISLVVLSFMISVPPAGMFSNCEMLSVAQSLDHSPYCYLITVVRLNPSKTTLFNRTNGIELLIFPGFVFFIVFFWFPFILASIFPLISSPISLLLPLMIQSSVFLQSIYLSFMQPRANNENNGTEECPEYTLKVIVAPVHTRARSLFPVVTCFTLSRVFTRVFS